MQLPWKESDTTVPSDYELCIQRLCSLQRKFLREPELIKEYNQIFEEQLNRGSVEKIPWRNQTRKKAKCTLPTSPRCHPKRPWDNLAEDRVWWISKATWAYFFFEWLSPDWGNFHSSVIQHADLIPAAQDWSYSRHWKGISNGWNQPNRQRHIAIPVAKGSWWSKLWNCASKVHPSRIQTETITSNVRCDNSTTFWWKGVRRDQTGLHSALEEFFVRRRPCHWWSKRE